ncbi:PREDICTED: protein COFACTOR ASSEMBLY OF COMPLEX C SUBUNIT B CCB2, chloroplastic-like [Tarenaya hassleriana]|uniref:protein COFACTOR ASSEMBLY OF COMPLEX C SUBUNIT B CCB2, chloroplastic-like n=1 Tax=Tarenaya hassleriana TaxID=28532 RepID=UPI00053C9861|nr:PREDICTED: protein COFACTOR ASSEMBLY OF COMPLEX C SUBUNIT B CCB2, chloroplastic-like [Tarenaya hassleriana]
MSIQVVNLLPLPKFAIRSRAKTSAGFGRVVARADNDPPRSVGGDQQQLNLSVLRFTFGIPGLDESYLPRFIGYGFGSLLLLNHFSGSGPTSDAQLRSEALGLSLAAFSVALPYIGKFLKGAGMTEQRTLPEEGNQIFAISSNISDSLKEDLAWATYVLLRNTSTIAVMISVRGELCVRGYWNSPVQMSKAQLLDWFKRKVDEIGLSDVKDTLYFPQNNSGSASWEILSEGTRSLLVQPFVQSTVGSQKMDGFLLIASTAEYAYSDKDRAWIQAIANKFRGPHELLAVT